MTFLNKLGALSLLTVSVKSIAVPTQSDTERSFLEFTAQHGKNYGTFNEFRKRMELWRATDDFIRTYPTDTFIMGHNEFSDWTYEEK